MSTRARAFSVEGEGGEDGSFRRQQSSFRSFVSADGSAGFPLQGGRYHLYVARACPWAHRTLVGRRLMGLEDVIDVSFVDPLRDDRGWRFSGGEYVDPVNGWEYLSEGYAAADPGYDARVTVPVLWDKERAMIVNNESSDILRMLSTVFAPLAEHPVELYPEGRREEIDALSRHIYDDVNNGVYKAGFASRQDVYEEAVATLFETLDELDARLAGRRFLFGPEPLETDWRLFTTLVRFDAVYQIHFKCSVRKLIEYEHLWPYARDLYQWPGIADTVDFDEIRTHYYRTHPMINPSGLVAVAPAARFEDPPGRG
ncbi:MAG: glutathione S-transferase C-terminal domain-containing protein [Solirubrobacteraceae bacterium]